MASTPQAPLAEDRHLPVLRDRCVELLAPALGHPGAVYVDGTLGMAGHAVAVLDAVPGARLVGIDRDAQALELARDRLTRAGHEGRFDLVHTTYDRIPEALAGLGLEAADAIMMDLGLSSFQIDTPDRGFSYLGDAPLDMRMDASEGNPTAADLLAELDEQEIARILHEYGDERYSRRIARDIVRARAEEAITRTAQLVALIDRAVPTSSKSGGHRAKRTFQALRIAVNEELTILRRAIDGALDSLALHGRLVVESYHSGEDRMVKAAFAQRTRSLAPAGLPVELEEHRAPFSLLTRGAEQADAGEQDINPRSASVRLRAIERSRPQH